MLKLALAGDTMLGRGVAERLVAQPRAPLLDPAVVDAAREADLFLLNLECCISDRGERFADPRKPFFFRAPPVAAERLAEIGVDAVMLANNHALDYGPDALLDTFDHLRAASVAWVGAGEDEHAARAPLVIERRGFRLRIVSASDHPQEFAAKREQPGIAYADLRAGGPPEWLIDAARPGPDCDAVLITPHWGPNMQGRPVAHVRRAADELAAAGATLIAGHSAHVFQGAAGRVLFDLGDFLDDYAVDPELRNDLGLLWLVSLDGEGPRGVEALPLALDYCYTRLASGDEHRLVTQLLRERCRVLGTEVEVGERLSIVLGGCETRPAG